MRLLADRLLAMAPTRSDAIEAARRALIVPARNHGDDEHHGGDDFRPGIDDFFEDLGSSATVRQVREPSLTSRNSPVHGRTVYPNRTDW